MVKVILKGGAELSAPSINGVCQEVAEHLGIKNPAGMNRTSAAKWLKRNGAESLEINGESVDLDDITTTARGRNPHALIERLIKATTTIDTVAIAALEVELVKKVSSAKTLEDLKEVQSLNVKIAELKNPRADLEAILKHVETLFNNYQAEQKQEQAQEQ